METLLGSDLSVGPMTLVNQKDKLEESAEQKREGDKPGSLIVSNIPALLTNKGVWRLFSKHGEVISMEFDKNRPGTENSSRRAFITMSTFKQAFDVQKVLNRASPLLLNVHFKGCNGHSNLLSNTLPAKDIFGPEDEEEDWDVTAEKNVKEKTKKKNIVTENGLVLDEDKFFESDSEDDLTPVTDITSKQDKVDLTPAKDITSKQDEVDLTPGNENTNKQDTKDLIPVKDITIHQNDDEPNLTRYSEKANKEELTLKRRPLEKENSTPTYTPANVKREKSGAVALKAKQHILPNTAEKNYLVNDRAAILKEENLFGKTKFFIGRTQENNIEGSTCSKSSIENKETKSIEPDTENTCSTEIVSTKEYGDGHSNNSKEADNCIKIKSCIPNVDIPKLNETSSLNLDETSSLTESGFMKRDETSSITESGSMIRGETSSLTESGFNKRDETSSITVSGSMIRGETSSITESGSIKLDETSSLAKSGFMIRDETSSITESGSMTRVEISSLTESGSMKLEETSSLAKSGSMTRGETSSITESVSMKLEKTSSLAKSGSKKLDEISSLTESGSMKLDETSTLTEIESIKLDETSSLTESGSLKLDETSSITEVAKLDNICYLTGSIKLVGGKLLEIGNVIQSPRPSEIGPIEMTESIKPEKVYARETEFLSPQIDSTKMNETNVENEPDEFPRTYAIETENENQRELFFTEKMSHSADNLPFFNQTSFHSSTDSQEISSSPDLPLLIDDSENDFYSLSESMDEPGSNLNPVKNKPNPENDITLVKTDVNAVEDASNLESLDKGQNLQLPPVPAPPIKSFLLAEGRTEVMLISSRNNFPEEFSVLPVSNGVNKSEIRNLLNQLEDKVVILKSPRSKSSAVVRHRSQLFRANIIKISPTNGSITVDLVDEGDIVTVKCDQVFRIPIQLWSVPATITTLSLHIPKFELWTDNDTKSLMTSIQNQDITVYVSPVNQEKNIQLVNLYLEQRICKDIFKFIKDKTLYTNTHNQTEPNLEDPDPEPEQELDNSDELQAGEGSKIEPVEHVSNMVGNGRGTFTLSHLPSRCIPGELGQLYTPISLQSSSPVSKPKFSFDPTLYSEEPPLEEPTLSLPFESPYSQLSATFSEKKLFLNDMLKLKVRSEEEYLFLDFGETSDMMYLVPVQNNIDSLDFSKLDTGMLESGLYPPLKRQPEVGEVLAAPRRYYSGTKYIRVEVLKLLKNGDVRVRGIDYKYRKTELVQNLRSISPDSSHYPVQSILVRLHQVSSKPRSLFKSLISDVVKQALDDPLIALVTCKDEIPVVELYSELAVDVSLNLIIEEDINISWCSLSSQDKSKLLSITEDKDDTEDFDPIRARFKQLEFAENTRNDSGYRGSVPKPVLSLPGDEEREDYLEVVKKFFSQNEDRVGQLTVGEEIKVVILRSESPEFVTVLPQSKIVEMQDMIVKYGKLASRRKFISENPVIGQVYLARSNSDNEWYRVLVVARYKNMQVKVFGLDFGFFEKVPASCLKEYTPSSSTLYSAILCEIENWDEDVPEVWDTRFKEVQENGELKQLEYTGDPWQLVEGVDAQKLKLSRRREIRRILRDYEPREVKVVRRIGAIFVLNI